ncbi:hypothetical protein D3C80_1584120 [compost metagenome]
MFRFIAPRFWLDFVSQSPRWKLVKRIALLFLFPACKLFELSLQLTDATGQSRLLRVRRIQLPLKAQQNPVQLDNLSGDSGIGLQSQHALCDIRSGFNPAVSSHYPIHHLCQSPCRLVL